MHYVIKKRLGLSDFFSVNGDAVHLTDHWGNVATWQSQDAVLAFCEREGIPEENVERRD